MLVAPVELRIATEMETLTDYSKESDEETETSLTEDRESYVPASNSFAVRTL